MVEGVYTSQLLPGPYVVRANSNIVKIEKVQRRAQNLSFLSVLFPLRIIVLNNRLLWVKRRSVKYLSQAMYNQLDSMVIFETYLIHASTWASKRLSLSDQCGQPDFHLCQFSKFEVVWFQAGCWASNSCVVECERTPTNFHQCGHSMTKDFHARAFIPSCRHGSSITYTY